jgi:hypothetical protein
MLQNRLGKFIKVLSQLLLVAVAAQAEERLEVGELTLAGSACDFANVAGEAPKVQIDQGFIQIPASTEVRKIIIESRVNGTCSFSLPLHVPKGQKLVVSQLLAPGSVDLSQGTRGQMTLEIFKSGDRGEQLIYEEKAEAGRLRKTILFEKERALFESACGEGFSLRGKTSIFLADGLRRSSMSLDFLQFKMELRKCEGSKPL